MVKITFLLFSFTMAGVAVVVAAYRTGSAERRLAKADDDACVACASTNVMVAAGKRLCISCGYEGSEDGGGNLTAREVASLYEPEGPNHGMFS